jgi:hypothetical protein
MVEARRRLVDDKTRYKKRLTALLKQYFPQILAWFADADSPVVLDLLDRWPTLDELKRVRRCTLERSLSNIGVDPQIKQVSGGPKFLLPFQPLGIRPS